MGVQLLVLIVASLLMSETALGQQRESAVSANVLVVLSC